MTATELCPACSSAVSREDDRCASCGSLLEPTVAEERAETQELLSGDGLEFRPGDVFAGRFTIIERIGSGGMGVVYKAIDKALDCEVALKLIRPEMAENPSYLERFRREVRITRQITHPNICRVHDIGSGEGLLYLSMEWIEGETLQQLLRKAGTLKEGRALAIAESIARALEAAHDKGMIHRDLKPANIMLDRRGNVYVLDFGLALETGTESISRVGAMIGTPLYMSPEQRSMQQVDGRTDLHALGLIMREMLTGLRPSTEDIPVEQQAAGISRPIEPVVRKLLAEREERYESAAAVRRDIQELLLDPAISTASTTASSAAAGQRRPRRLGLSIAAAVVPVAAVAALSYVFFPSAPERLMDPRAETFYARGQHYLRDKRETGSPRILDDAIQMFHRALDFEPDSALVLASLGEAYWLRFEDWRLLSSREEAERAVNRAYELDPDLPEVLTARALGYMIESKYYAAKADLEMALESKPELYIAWLYLGEVHQNLENYAEGLEAIRRAMTLEPANVRITIRLGLFHQHFGENDEAFRYFEMATELNPDNFHAWNNLGAAYLYTGRYEEAVPVIQRALAVTDSAFTRSNLGTALYSLGKYEEAIAQYEYATELEPGVAVHWGNLGDALQVRGEEDRAVEAYAQASELARARLDLQPISAEALSAVALYCAKARESEEAIRYASAAHELQPDNPKILLVNAVVNCIIGRDDDSLDWLDRAIKRGASKAEIELVPEFSRLRDDPRFRRILELAS
jgi:serine/threonine protein kinase